MKGKGKSLKRINLNTITPPFFCRLGKSNRLDELKPPANSK